MFKYKGPKGVKIGCILDEAEAKQGLKLQTDIATPKFLAKLLRDGDVQASKLRVIVYDEADLTLEQTPDNDLNALFRNEESERDFNRLTYLVGASVTESLGELCVSDSVLPQGNSFIATAMRFAPLVVPSGKNESDTNYNSDNTAPAINTLSPPTPPTSSATLQDLSPCLDPGLLH